MLSCTMSRADSSLRTWYIERLKARFSTLCRKSESSFSVAKGVGQELVQRGVRSSAVVRKTPAIIASERIFYTFCAFSLLQCDNERLQT